MADNEDIKVKTTWLLPKSLVKQLKQYALDNDTTLTYLSLRTSLNTSDTTTLILKVVPGFDLMAIILFWLLVVFTSLQVVFYLLSLDKGYPVLYLVLVLILQLHNLA